MKSEPRVPSRNRNRKLGRSRKRGDDSYGEWRFAQPEAWGLTPGCATSQLRINPYKPHLIISPGDGHIKESEDTKSNFEELLGKEYDYSKGSEDSYERYQYSHKDDDHSKDHRKEKLYQHFYQQIQNEYDKERPSDCTIVSINKDQRDYAVSIGHRLQDHGLVVEMIYLTSEASLTCALQEVKNDGSPFCILVEQSNVALSSCTVISLHKSITIHRHMPLEDALALVAKEFGTILAEREQQEGAGISQKAADLVDDYLERDLCESYSVPLSIKHLLFLLSEGKHLYQEELNTISGYLKTRKEELEGFVETPDTSTAVVNALIEANLMPRSHPMGKPPPLLPTPGRNAFQGQPLLPPAKPPLLGDRPGGLLPTPGHSGPKGKPPPLLAVPSKRPGLLGYAPHQPAKRPLMWEKPALLPTPVAVQTVQPQRAAKPKPF
ncbi:nuclear receptor coactivator 5-like [Petaurus breviceps papuanus]|uniref:nuclear receptor coactivator 5-like n=1 Tax=Petaurus breviceps papuanus TaxID=3040969 RepID=UPI0036DF3674